MGVYETVRTTTTTYFETLVYAYTSFICILPQLLLVIIISITTKHILAKFFSKFLKREFLTSSTPQSTHISTTICSSISQCPSQLFARVREQTRRTKSTRAFLAKRVTQTRLVSRSVARVYRLRVHASLFERRHVHLLLFSIFSLLLLLLLLKLLLLGRRRRIIIITIVLIIISSAAMTTVYGRRRRTVVHRRRHPDMFVLVLQKLLLSVIIVIICSSSSSTITR